VRRVKIWHHSPESPGFRVTVGRTAGSVLGGDMRRLERVVVLYNEPVLPIGHPDYLSEHEVLDNVEAVSTALAEAGYEVARLGARNDPGALLAGLTELRPDVVFNLFEGLGNNNITEAYVAGLLDWLGCRSPAVRSAPSCWPRAST